MSGPRDHRMPLLPTLAGAVGNVLEWYDFGLYGLFAPILAPLFFPAQDRIASLIGAYGGFAIGFAARPLGGVVLGHVGDRVGRRAVSTRYATEPVYSPPTEKPCSTRMSNRSTGAPTPIAA